MPRPVIEAEVIHQAGTVQHRAAAKVATTPPRRRRTGLRVVSFVGFVVLCGGVWGWGAFATFVFAFLSTTAIASWAER